MAQPRRRCSHSKWCTREPEPNRSKCTQCFLRHALSIRKAQKPLRDLYESKRAQAVCVDAGQDRGACCGELEADHRDPSQKVHKLSVFWYWTNKREAFVSEFEKIEWRCCAHHRMRSHDQVKSEHPSRASRARRDDLRWAYVTRKGARCADCGRLAERGTFRYYFDFDHVREPKRADISTLVHQGPDEALVQELEKTEVCCVACHRARTRRRSAQATFMLNDRRRRWVQGL